MMFHSKNDLYLGFFIIVAILVAFPLIVLLGDKSWIILLAVGTATCFYGAYRLWKSWTSQAWVKNKGTIESAIIDEYIVYESENTRRTYYYPIIMVSYQVNGHSYSSSKTAIDIKSYWSTDKKLVERSINPFLEGSLVPIYVNPKNPNIAILFLGLSNHRTSHYAAIVTGGLLISITAIIIGLL